MSRACTHSPGLPQTAQQIGEALGDLEAVLLDPSCCLGGCSLEDAAGSLAGEFVGLYQDDEIVRRLGELGAAGQAGQLRIAGRHLRAVRDKLAKRWGITPLASVPLILDGEAKRLAATARSGVAKVLVAGSRSRPGCPPVAGAGSGTAWAPNGRARTG